ncbi:hypothetical protein C9F11_38165 [Streptomyces sp. YIM 121038]|nr:hypothetical protein C9F11_38165 [Streptomyces sp. YIM 121038]
MTLTDETRQYTITCGSCDGTGQTPTLADNEDNGQAGQ